MKLEWYLPEKRFTPENIESLKENEIFVFGSNLEGLHDGGAARTAVEKFGAIYGQGVGLQGQSYAIPTMQGGLETIRPYVDEFIEFAKKHTDKTFYVTRIGCGIAGFKDKEIAPLFLEARFMENVHMAGSFYSLIVDYLLENREREHFEEAVQEELTVEIMKSLSSCDVIYAEVSEMGAMGTGGQTMMYVFKDDRLVVYYGRYAYSEDGERISVSDFGSPLVGVPHQPLEKPPHAS